ncbi:alkaline phosphatase [Rhizobiales bacterium GAS191]|jgi:membrane protein DedA with SNARE-associated domain|nr:alkaline phosphatase [Rhizobiales bacterium GAS191]
MDTSGIVTTLMSFGLAGILCLSVVEKFIPLFPSYVLLMLLGMTVPDGASLAMMIMATSIGSVVGAVGWYGLGRALGSRRVEAVVARFGKYVLLGPSLYGKLTNAYRRNHFWVTLIGQIMPTARVYLALPAGVLGLEPRAFLVATSLGTLIWNIPFLSLGYVLRDSGRDPVSFGASVAVILVATELAILLGARFVQRRMVGAPAVALPDRHAGS